MRSALRAESWACNMTQHTDGRRGLPRRLRLAMAAGAAVLLLVILRKAAAQLLFQALLAVLLAWAARPLCARLERRLPAGIAALGALLTFLAALLGLLWLFVPQLLSQLSLAASAVPQLIDLAREGLDRLAASELFRRLQLPLSPSEELMQRAGTAALNAVPAAVQRMAGIGSRLARAFLAPVLAFYFLRDREVFCFQLSLLIPLRARRRTLTALKEMRREIAAYFRGQLLVSGSVGILTAISLLTVGVPAWLLLGLVMGICDLIPYAGPYLGALPILLFSLPQGIYTALWALIAVVLVQPAESVFLSPRLMSGVTGLHPAYVLMLLSAGGILGGLAGMLLSLPLFVCLRGAARALQCARQAENP